MNEVVFLDLAEQEMLAAAKNYETRAVALGIEFLGEIQPTAGHIAEHPLSGSLLRWEIRRRLLLRFPFGLLYRLGPEPIIVIALCT